MSSPSRRSPARFLFRAGIVAGTTVAIVFIIYVCWKGVRRAEWEQGLRSRILVAVPSSSWHAKDRLSYQELATDLTRAIPVGANSCEIRSRNWQADRIEEDSHGNEHAIRVYYRDPSSFTGSGDVYLYFYFANDKLKGIHVDNS